MKTITALTFSELSKEKQTELLAKKKNSIIEFMIEEPSITAHTGLKTNFQKAIDESERLQTPWFLGNILMEDKEIASYVERCAIASLNETLFVDGSEENIVVL